MRHARRSKEKVHYLGGLVSGLVSLAFISMYFMQVTWFFLLIGVSFIIVLAIFPIVISANQRKAAKMRRETNVLEPLKARELLNWKGLYKLASRWGTMKTRGLYVLFTFGPLAPLLCVLYIADLSVMPAAPNGSGAGFIGIILFYQQLRRNHLNPQENMKHTPLAEPSA